MKAVLDTNVIVSRYLSPNSIAAHILSAWEQNTFTLVVSEDILAEYGAVLQYDHIRKLHSMNELAIQDVIDDFREVAVVVHPKVNLTVVTEDPKDDIFLECGVEGNVNYIVSGDHHLLALHAYQGIHILPPAHFLEVLKEERAKKAA